MPSERARESTDIVVTPAERYERGLALKNAGLYKAAIDQFEMAVADSAIALKAYAQIGVCFKLSNRYREAVEAFQKALSASTGSSKETIPILYILGRTLESLGQVEETLEAYRWIRREEPEYRDVAARIERLSSRRSAPAGKKNPTEAPTRSDSFLKFRQSLLGISR